MKLLFRRSQSHPSLNFAPNFMLWAMVELDEEERSLVSRYDMSGAIIIKTEQPGHFQRSILLGVFCFAVLVPTLAWGFWRTIGLGWPGIFAIALVLACISGYIFYHQKRERIYMKDLMVGRNFKCKSIIELAQKEARMEGITATLRQVLEAAKHWGGTETKDVPVLSKEDALALIKRL